MPSKIHEITKQLNTATFEEKREVYRAIYSVGYSSTEDLNDRLILISLITLVYQKMKAKKPDVTPLEILLQITPTTNKNSSYYQYLESLSILVEDFSYGVVKIDSCGLKNSTEIINKIKDLLSTWLPF